MNEVRIGMWPERFVSRPVVVASTVVAVTLVALAGMARLEFDDDYRAIFRSESPDFHALEELSRDFGGEDNHVVVMLVGDDLLSPDSLIAIGRVHDRLEQLDSVASVYSMATVPELAALLRRQPDGEALERVAARLRDHPLIKGRLLSSDATAALIAVHLGDEPLSVAALEARLGAIHETVTGELSPHLRALVSGIPAMRVEAVRGVQRDQLRFNVLALLLAGCVTLVVFRRPVAWLLTGIGPIVGVVWTLGAMGWVGESINVVNNLVPQLVLAIGLTDSIHLLLFVGRRRRRGEAGRPAAAAALRHVGLACLLTSVTTAVGFASLVLTDSDVVARFGLACATGVILSLFAVLAVVPLLAAGRLGDRLWAGRRSRSGASDARPVTAAAERPLAFAGRLLCHSTAVVSVFVILTVALAAATVQLSPDYRYSENVAGSSLAARAMRVQDASFGGSLPLYVRVDWPEGTSLDAVALEVVGEVAGALEAVPSVAATTSVLDLLQALPGRDPSPAARLGGLQRLPADLVRRWVNEERGSTVVASLVPDLGARKLYVVLEELEERLQEIAGRHPRFRLQPAGLTVVSTRASIEMIGDLARSLATAALVIFTVLVLAFRSAWVALASLVPNFFPLASVGAVLFLLGEPLRYSTVAVFGIGLGLAVDDTIHFLTAYRRAASSGGRSREQAVVHTLHTVGLAMCVTTALLIAGIAPLLMSGLFATRLFGAAMCTLLLAALLADLVALPAILVRLGPRTVDPAATAPRPVRPATVEEVT